MKLFGRLRSVFKPPAATREAPAATADTRSVETDLVMVKEEPQTAAPPPYLEPCRGTSTPENDLDEVQGRDG
jgi:hypothetical protein